MRRRTTGLTLVELLVAMAIIGIIFAVVTQWQASTLAVTTQANAQSQGLIELNDLTGYLGDRVRAALRVRVEASGSGMSINGRNCTSTNPCLAVVLPDSTATGIVTKYNLYVYRIEPRSLVTDDKVTDAWAEGKVVILREYRSENSGSSPVNCVPTAPATFETDTSAACTTMRGLSTANTLSGFGPYLVADYLTPSAELGTGVVPFAYSAVIRTVTLAFQNKQQVRGQPRLTPAAPYSLDVQARNVPPICTVTPTPANC